MTCTMPAHTLTAKCWWQWADTAWGFASAQTWLLWLENPLLGEVSLIHEQLHCKKAGLLCTLVCKAMYKLVLTKIIIGTRACIFCQWKRWSYCSCIKFHMTMIHTVCVTNCSGAGRGVILKTLQMYQFPIGDGWQKQSYYNLGTLFGIHSW